MPYCTSHAEELYVYGVRVQWDTSTDHLSLKSLRVVSRRFSHHFDVRSEYRLPTIEKRLTRIQARYPYFCL